MKNFLALSCLICVPLVAMEGDKPVKKVLGGISKAVLVRYLKMEKEHNFSDNGVKINKIVKKEDEIELHYEIADESTDPLANFLRRSLQPKNSRSHLEGYPTVLHTSNDDLKNKKIEISWEALKGTTKFTAQEFKEFCNMIKFEQLPRYEQLQKRGQQSQSSRQLVKPEQLSESAFLPRLDHLSPRIIAKSKSKDSVL